LILLLLFILEQDWIAFVVKIELVSVQVFDWITLRSLLRVKMLKCLLKISRVTKFILK
jgi:hypothetical protein